MSDFLGNLAATALQVAPLAQPRTPMLFEPRTVSSNDVPLIESSEVYSVDASSRQSAVETRRTERENVTHTNTLSTLKANVLDSRSQSEVTTFRSELQPSTIAAQPVMRTEPVSAAEPMQKIEPSGREEQSGRAEAAHSVVEETTSQVSISPLMQLASSHGIIEPRIERNRREAQVEREASEPRIHISIGRIEVRAATAPAPTRAARREASTLNLDDYLRQRR